VRVFCCSLAVILCTAGSAWILWNPGPESTAHFDRCKNGIWAGHQWYTGRKVSGGDTVTDAERDRFIAELRDHGITTVFVHAGPIRPDGSIADMPGIFFNDLQKFAPDILFLPWIGGDLRKYALAKPQWRSSLIATIWRMKQCGVRGVHLDIEPVKSFEPGYLELLRELRLTSEDRFYISHATRRIGLTDLPLPPVKKFFWTGAFYRECMRHTDQTVLMGYDTCIRSRKLYTASIRMQTRRLLGYTGKFPGHSLMIGIPSYDDNPGLHDPDAENIRSAALGVRAALEGLSPQHRVLDGVAVYAHWTTDPLEWHWFDVYWRGQM